MILESGIIMIPNDNMVTSEWRKDGTGWFYLDDDGDMLTMSWVDDESYVNERGKRLVNSWIKVPSDDSIDDPGEDGDHWYYFDSKGRKLTSTSKKINGKTYYFDEDGKMATGWYENRLYFYNDKIYLVNSKGKIQKGKKGYNIENSSISEDKVSVEFKSDSSVKSITLDEGKGTSYTAAQLLAMSLNTDSTTSDYVDEDGRYDDAYVTIPFIQLYDNNVYTYRFINKKDGSFDASEMWYDVHEKITNRWK